MSLRFLNFRFAFLLISALFFSQAVFLGTASAAFNCSNFDLLAYYGGGVVSGHVYKPEPNSGLWKFSISEDCTLLTSNHESLSTETIIDGNYHMISQKVIHDNNTNKYVVLSKTFQKCIWTTDSKVECEGYVEYKVNPQQDVFSSSTLFSQNAIIVEQKNSKINFLPAFCDNNPRSKFCR